MVRRSPNLFLRKHRRWPLSPNFKTKFHQILSQKQAFQSFKQLLLLQVSVPKPNLLSSLLRSFSLYNVRPTPQAYYFLIKTLLQNRHFNSIPPVLHYLQHVEEFEIPEYVFADLIKTYGDADRIQDAVDIFYRIPNFRCAPSAHSLNSLLAILCRNQSGLKLVPRVLLQSLVMRIRIEESTFRILISALCRINKVAYAIDILQRMIEDGLDVSDNIFSFILSSVCAEEDLDSEEFMKFWRELRKLGFCPAMGDYNRVIRFLVKKGKGLEARDVLNQMKIDGIKPGIVSYTLVLNGMVAEGDYMLADELFDELLILGLVPDVYTYNAYIDALCKQNKVEEGIKMVACMEELGCKPNVLTYNTLLEAVCDVGEICRVRKLVTEMKYKGIEMNFVSYSVIIDCLLSRGEIVEAYKLAEEALHKCPCHWTFTFDELICCLCQRGLVSEALDLLKKIVDVNISPAARVWEALILSFGNKLNSAKTTLIDLVSPY